MIFVEGAARSGTSWVTALLTLHPAIAGMLAEAHLFNHGVDRLFDNHEASSRRNLSAWVSRQELVDLVRDLCDGVLLNVIDSTGSEARFVLEKTPLTAISSSSTESILARKLECFPDAWFVQIVRDGHSVARSMARMPWMGGRSEKRCYEIWQRTVNLIRKSRTRADRYREVSYEALLEDPSAVMAEVIEWLGLEADEEYLAAVKEASNRPYDIWSRYAKPPGWHKRLGKMALGGLRSLERSFARLRRVRRGRPIEHGADPSTDAALAFIDAVRYGAEEEVAACTTESVAVDFSSPEKQIQAKGDEAREALLTIGANIFGKRLAREEWGISTGRSWIGSEVVPSVTVFLRGSREGGDPVELVVGMRLEGPAVSNAVLVTPQKLT